MPTNTQSKPAATMPRHQVVAAGQIDAGLGEDLEGEVVRAHPCAERPEQRQRLLAIADEVVVDHEERAAKARRQDGVELAAELRGLLGARPPAEQLDDVAEFAIEGTAAAPLHAHGVVGADVEQVVARRRELA